MYIADNPCGEYHIYGVITYNFGQPCSIIKRRPCTCRKVRATFDPHTVASGWRSSTEGMRPLWSGSVWLTNT